MTTSKYKRLVMVLILPLFLAGYAAAKLLWPYDPYANITCAPSFTGLENCRNVGDGSLYESVKSEHPAWFVVHVGDYDEDAYLRDFVEASARMIAGAKIIRASPFVGNTSDAKAIMESFTGKSAIVMLGIEGDQRSIISDKVSVLHCNSLWIGDQKHEYTSMCYGNGWSGSVTYRASGLANENIEKLRTEIEKEISDRKNYYNIFRVVMYPLFIYMFFIFSFLVWAILWAVRFVRMG